MEQLMLTGSGSSLKGREPQEHAEWLGSEAMAAPRARHLRLI